MEKKLKYLFGLFVFLFGFFYSHVFSAGGYTIPESSLYVEGVTLPLTSSNYSSSSSYRYRFNNFGYRGGYSSRVSSMLYSLRKDGVEIWYPYSLGQGQVRDCSFDGSLYKSNNSVIGLELYDGWRKDVYVNGNCLGFFGNQSNGNSSFGGFSPIKISFGEGVDFGKAFVYVNELVNYTGVLTPHYGLGYGFFSNISSKTISMSTDSNNNFVRIFYNQNVNLSSPLDGYDLVYSSGINMNTGFVAWESFTSNSVLYQTKYNDSSKYIIDYGREGNKGLHFGGYGMGYSFAVNFSVDPQQLFRGNWSFGSVGSRCIESAMNLGITDFDTLTLSSCSSLGLLVLKGDSYVSRQNNASVIVLGKNPNNTNQILYEQFDCADDDLLRIMGSSGGFCNSLSHGYITINGSSNVLPFGDKMTSYSLGSGNSFLDFIFTNGLYGYTSINIDDNMYCLNSSSNSLCFGLHATPQLKSLKEMYLDAGGNIAGNGGTVGGQGLDDIIINNPDRFYTYSGLVEYAMSGVFYVEEDTGYIEDYVDYDFLNGVPQLKNLKFGVCPFRTNSNFATLGLKDFSFDMLVPHKCILAGIQAGYTSVNMSGFDLGLNKKFIDSNLNNDNVELIGHFVAILFIFGIFSLLFYFLKFFK